MLDEMTPAALKVAQAARILQVDQRTVRNMFHDGRLKGFEVGRTIRVSRESVMALVNGENVWKRHRRARNDGEKKRGQGRTVVG